MVEAELHANINAFPDQNAENADVYRAMIDVALTSPLCSGWEVLWMGGALDGRENTNG
ncbi:hypothetical protein [Microvirga sp. M2]|uniref:hypothetical protein n=1 Tax=Microvirga sp. M2 TaxID=3073270 RepID=UPI0039C00A2A